MCVCKYFKLNITRLRISANWQEADQEMPQCTFMAGRSVN